MPPFKDEHILIIAPGSLTTLAQLGLPESFTPARLRIPTRMFPGERKGEWEPYKIREKIIRRNVANGSKLTENGMKEDVEMGEAGSSKGKEADDGDAQEEDEVVYEEDPNSDEGAVYPLEGGRIVDWSCFLALLTHIHNTLSPPFHTPILLISQPVWTAQNHETLTQFFFEKFKTPAFCLMDSGLAACYAYGLSTATIIDVGYEKADVTAVTDFMVNDIGRGLAIAGCGGEAMTAQLLKLLGPKGWSREMCEQLKKSNICEILPQGTPLPGSAETESQIVTNPAAAASTGAVASGPGQRITAAAQGEAPRGPGLDTDVGDEADALELKEAEDGVLDVAAIVTSGKTSEFLARKEKEKAERAASRKAAAEAAAGPAKPLRLPNAKRDKNTFLFEEKRQVEEESRNENGKRAIDEEGPDGTNSKRQKTPELSEPALASEADINPSQEPVQEAAGTEASRRQQEKAARKEERRKNRLAHGVNADTVRRELEVGIERFRSTGGGNLDALADSIHRTVLAVDDISKRSELWDSLIILGNGSKVKGFKEALVATLNSKYLISPSSGTIFTSELPSNLSTPLATGANTPQPQPPGMPPGGPGVGSHVNPLLYAATTASNPALNSSALAPPPTQLPPGSHQAHTSHGQTPTSIKVSKAPEYFPEWKDAGFEEAAFLGAQVAAKVVFVVDQGVSKGFMTRVEYNDLGPSGIHEMSL